MKLETAQSFSSSEATPSDIRYAVSNDTQRGEFLILSQTEMSFIQAHGDAEPFFVEFYSEDDSRDQPHQCRSQLTANELEELLLKYLAKDDDWSVAYEWVVEPQRPWWRFW